MGLNTSDKLTSFLTFVDQSKTQYRICSEELTRLNKLQEDLLHAIEFNSEGYRQRNKLATQLEQCRKDRRWYKDRVGELEPIVSFLEDQSNNRSINLLKNTLGKIRKEEAYHAKRTYYPRSLSPEVRQFFEIKNKYKEDSK